MNASEVDVIIMQLMSSGVGFDVHIKLWSLLLLQKLWCFFSFLHYKTLNRPDVCISNFTIHILYLKSNSKFLKWKTKSSSGVWRFYLILIYTFCIYRLIHTRKMMEFTLRLINSCFLFFQGVSIRSWT